MAKNRKGFMDIKECSTCGAKYEITEYHCLMRDMDMIRCNYCNEILISWNGAIMYKRKELNGPTKEYKSKTS